MTPQRSPQLILISDHGDVPVEPPPPPSMHRLARGVVDAARNYAELMYASAQAIDPGTEEGALRLALLDAVQDLDSAETSAATVGSAGTQQTLFG